MEKNRNKNLEIQKNPESAGRAVTHQVEDAAMKTVMQFFAEELLPCFGIEGKAIRIAPTELIHLEVKKLFEDFNLEMEDGSWVHFEFQSTNEGVKGLKRFRAYEALASYQYNVSITTYVLFSGNIQNPMTQFTDGINTYRIQPIIMRHRNVDQLIRNIRRKIKSGAPAKKEDVISLILGPLMGGETSMPDRIRTALWAVRQTEELSMNEIRKAEAVVYAMAEKFLEKIELDEIGREMRMTRLGEMLVQEGIQEGEGRINQLYQKLIQSGRMEDLVRATKDKDYLYQLYMELKL